MDKSTFSLLVWTCFPVLIWCHARLMSPPSRSSMWRVGFATRKNFNDNALYCGGMTIQWQQNGGKCGICGDPYDMPHPRENEAGGKYGRGIISKRYLSGQVIEATVDITTNHRGYFEFKLCPNNNPKKEATQECLDKYKLKEAHGIGTRYYVGDRGSGDITVKLQLPKGLTCSQCVFQWTYVAGNNWGLCEDGASRLGCGPQETFRGCADIAIEKSTDIFNIKTNENEVGSRLPNEHSHKNSKQGHPKYKPETKQTEYDHAVLKNTRNITTNPHSKDNHDHQIHKKRFNHKNGDYFPLTSQRPEKRKRRPSSTRQNSQSNVNRTKFRKYENRHFYHNINHSSARPYPVGTVVPRDSNLANNFKHRVAVNANQPVSKKRNIERPKRRQPRRNPSPMFSDSEEDESLSEGFNLGGSRYNDFWFL